MNNHGYGDYYNACATVATVLASGTRPIFFSVIFHVISFLRKDIFYEGVFRQLKSMEIVERKLREEKKIIRREPDDILIASGMFEKHKTAANLRAIYRCLYNSQLYVISDYTMQSFQHNTGNDTGKPCLNVFIDKNYAEELCRNRDYFPKPIRFNDFSPLIILCILLLYKHNLRLYFLNKSKIS